MDYSGFDLIDEQFVKVETLVQSEEVLSAGDSVSNFKQRSIQNESIVSVGKSHWRIIPEVTFYNDQDTCICYYKDKKLSVELVEFSFPNPLEYAVEVLIFGRDKDGNYPVHVVEKKRETITEDVLGKSKCFIHVNEDEYGKMSEIGRKRMWHSDREIDDDDDVKLQKVFDIGIIIRVLKMQTDAVTIYSPPTIPTDVDLIVGDKRFPVNSIYLSACSPVFAAMFQLDMKEHNTREVEIKDVASAEHFGDFLRALPRNSIRPNPENIFDITELADRYQALSLLSDCKRSLINCVERPLIERFLFADRHKLEEVKAKILLSMDPEGIKKFYKENKAAIDAHPNLAIELLTRIIA